MMLGLRSMGGKRSSTTYLNLEICTKLFVSFLLIYAARLSLGVTNPGDVAAINSLHTAMGSPVLPGWVGSGGDPCGEQWQGVACNGSDIQSIVLNAANLGGELGDNLGNFASIKSIDLSNNQIGGSIPSNLPVTMQNFFLSANQFSGSIPDSLSSLTLLTDMSLNDNLLSGEIPDAFQILTGLINLDLSSNNLSGELPPSLENLSSLTTLHLQENQLSGTLDVLQDLPLRDLNIENNLFTGPIPDKILSIPVFRKDGNPFNTTVAILPSPPSPTLLSPSTVPPQAPTPPGAPSFWHTPWRDADGPSSSEESNGGTREFWTKKRIVWVSIAGVILFIIIALGLVLFMPRCSVRREEADGAFKQHRVGAYGGRRENPRDSGSVAQSTNQMEKVSNVAVMRPKEDHQIGKRRNEAAPKQQNEQERNVRRMSAVPKREDHSIDMSEYDMLLMPPPLPPPPPPPPPPHAEKVIVRPIVPAEVTTAKPSSKAPNIITSAKSFTIAALQQYTNSFSQENLIGGGMLGNVYRAQLPDGKLLAVKKLDKRVSDQQKDDEFLELVNNIDLIRHANVVELVGYCAEHGQRLLIYEYCSNGTLQDALHSDDELRKKLSWNTRIHMALGAARALEYLHEICQPPVVHRNFKSANVLLDDDLSIRVSDCGLAPLISKGSVSQLSGHLLSTYGYGAPEFESGIYTYQSDVYSFGVVLLELLTGRKSYDRTRNRGEQLLVRWAIPQLHDIDALSRMVDPSLNGEYTAKSLSHFADTISRCVQSEPEFRPPMSEVVQDLRDMMRRECSSNETDN
ncbi:protein STRUBBELIG-RECEPTOR FAMILY 3-like [Tripterygium wilfordii]|uniref:protein STRUBBELIG-RECEPTOR FAMILY 3-like n=1 Tax=Tripterygium wilfordii TaxID=458696 RepID=UPI0018F847DE|nr:protein STRUBBELIG-RECEPTOR FAMILY 3-like [Tripterygium wilfordii]